jgi:Planctomycete cytochrome C
MRWALPVLVCLAMVYLSCKHEPLAPDPNSDPNNPNNPGNTGRECSPDTIYFGNTIQPLINSTCATPGCHDAITQEEGLNLSTYAGIRKIVEPGNAASSELFKEIIRTDNERMPPPPKPRMTNDQILLIQKWINQGVKENACDACDTSNFKYSTAINPLLQNKCVGCHNPNSLGGGIDLSTYNVVKRVADNGQLYGSIAWLTGYAKMPKGGIKLPDCEILQVKKWIDAGALNN